MERKKGIALNEAFGAVLMLVLIAVLVIVAIILFVNLGSTFTNLATISVVNETLLAVNETTQYVDQSPKNNATLCNYEDFTAIAVTNETNELITSGNYTVDSATGSIVYSGAGDYNNTIWDITYSANWGGESCVASNAMITQFGTYPVLVGLVGTIIFLGLVIGVLVASFVFGGRRRV